MEHKAFDTWDEWGTNRGLACVKDYLMMGL